MSALRYDALPTGKLLPPEPKRPVELPLTTMLHPLFFRFFVLWLAASLFGTLALAQTGLTAATSSVVTTPHVRAELIAQAPQGIAPGQPLWLGLQITHQPDWHSYWKNPGDSGLPTELHWELPAGLETGEILWPIPRPIRVETLVNYGYEGEVLLAVPVQVTPLFKPPLLASGNITLRLRASWLVCRVECIPEEGQFTLTLPVQGSTALHSAAFEQQLATQPVTLAGEASAQVDGEHLQVRVAGLPASVHGQALLLLPETPAVLQHLAQADQRWTQTWDGAIWTARLPLSPDRGENISSLPLLLVAESAYTRGGALAGAAWRTLAPIQGQWTPAARAELSPALAAALAASSATPPAAVATPTTTTWLLALLGGLVGGMLLNLMPCVFPILALKVVGFARHGQAQRTQRLAGAAYTAGVVLSFLALGGLLLALRAAGEQLGWGFQLQSPAVVAALAALFTLIGLNLAGLFEFGQFVPSGLASMQVRHPVADAFLSGVLAVAVASPCTAPFMGASLGLAVALPTWQALAVFAALGLGMALPYLLATWVPAVVRCLPRPGAWMQTFRQALAFPMFATVVWLVWVLGQQSGMDGAGALLALLVALAALVWAFALPGRSRWWLVTLALLGNGWLLAVLGHYVTQPAPAHPSGEGITAAASLGEQRWQPWSAQRVAELSAAGQLVFIDFTAAWCVTCQYNKRTTLADAGLLAEFAARKVALLRADWTLSDPAITAALTQLGRSGVPVYVLYAPGRAPVVFTEILSVQEVRTALQAL